MRNVRTIMDPMRPAPMTPIVEFAIIDHNSMPGIRYYVRDSFAGVRRLFVNINGASDERFVDPLVYDDDGKVGTESAHHYTGPLPACQSADDI